ncbi:MAG: 4Fe-4S binding protein [Butyrivibrio sp.]|nr:4Fe-4S binding protein [Butyrivibrio sp.]
MRELNIEQQVPLNVLPEYVPEGRSTTDADRTGSDTAGRNNISPENLTARDLAIAAAFKMPDAAIRLIDFFFTEDDRSFIEKYTGKEIPASEIDEEYRKSAFSRGVISKVDPEGERYTLNDFYGMLDVFSVSQTYKYHTLSRSTRKELDDWYFGQYMQGLDPDLTKRPTADRVLSLEEMEEFIDGLKRPLFWSFCDCKSLSGDCGLPSHTCISYAPGINSFAARGCSEEITAEEAKEIVRKADKAGLVHTVSDHGICNCCDDCCYLFRGQKVRNSVGFWPASPHIIEFDAKKCVACGKCLTRCHFKVFAMEASAGNSAATSTTAPAGSSAATSTTAAPASRNATSAPAKRTLALTRANCIGCGLCANTCPTGALKLGNRIGYEEL